MKIEGKIETISDHEEIIARFLKLPQIGASVFDNKKKFIGEVGWIFGPVENPYVEIKLNIDSKKRLTMMREKIYVEEI
ncbi:MAG: hypothetical protein KGY66_02140 [Candidatus Thermoplasmatota archaeon]|nr:hypothetical protein [Candidatus Thermoplasmatota archaeon]MBS3789697.1 hypothetical protein [Candidatus Thermoplasmatota archaeon]